MALASRAECATEAHVVSNRLSDQDFRRIAALVSDHTGIKLPQTKRLMVEGRLRKRANFLGYPGVSAYCRHLFDGKGLEAEFTHLVDAVTTNKTDFFREADHFRFLEEHIVPNLLAARAGPRRLKLWSAASSFGAEAYTIAMVMAELALQRPELRFAVLGTDISTQVLDQARRAIYPEEMIEPVPRHMQQRYIMRGESADCQREVRIVPELRRVCHFQHLNLMDGHYPIDRDVDVIFLRNVLIYFERETQEAVVSRLFGHLRPGGYLILGHSESMIGTNLNLTQLAPAIFRKD